MRAIKKLFKIVILLALVVLAGYFLFNHFFINATSQLDEKTPEEQAQVLIGSDEYAGLEEVAALKEQLQRLKEGKSPVVEEGLEASGNGSSPQGSEGYPENLDNSRESYSRSIPPKTAIENTLRTKMYSLQSEYNGKLNALVGQAKAEYVRLRASNSKVNAKDLASKYIAKGNSLEAQCDARVYAAIAYAENQLRFYNYKSTVAREAREQYVQVKAQRRKSLMNSIK